MFALLIVPVLVAGFMTCHIHPVHSYRLHRYEGQYLYLKSAELGLKCFGLACSIAALFYWRLPAASDSSPSLTSWASMLASFLQNAGIAEPQHALRTSCSGFPCKKTSTSC